jgi:hypothetical protein
VPAGACPPFEDLAARVDGRADLIHALATEGLLAIDPDGALGCLT